MTFDAPFDTTVALLFAVLGALIGSFSNVLIHRLPRGESVAFPPSRCPSCGRRLRPAELVPVLSWAALGGRCRGCRSPISWRYPLVEGLTALGYGLLALLFPWSKVGVSLLGLCFLFTALLVISFIDAETHTIPDGVVLPGAALGLGLGLVNGFTGASLSGLPGFGAALAGALLGSGVIALIALYGELALRRGRERSYPEFPVSYQQVALAALAGAWLGAGWGVGLGLLGVLANLLARRAVRLPETPTLLALLASLMLGASGVGPGVIGMAQGALAAAGGLSLLAALYWWSQPEEEAGDHDPVAMGFGDVKLAALLGAFLGVTGVVVSLGVAVLAGAAIGVVILLLRGDNRVPFGPYMALGALITLLFGAQIVGALRALYGLG